MADFKGLQGLRAYKAMMAIVRSLYFIAEVSEGKDYKEFLEWFDNQSKDELTRLFKVGVVYGLKLDSDEVLDLVGYCKDKNNVKIGKENLNSMPVKELVDKMVEVCLELSEIKVFF